MEYNFREIEENWQKYWAENETFKAENISDKPKFFVLDMFPYPSGAGLHVGHPLGYIASDIYARYKRHKGFNVMHPQGYDSFGLPAEQYAIQTGQHPAVTTAANVKTYRKQLDKIGFSFDWSREVRTSDPNYYKWTQWIFIQLFNSWYNKTSDKAEDIETLISIFKAKGNATVKAACEDEIALFSAKDWKKYSEEEKQNILLKYRLTFLSETEVNWCPALGTVLANDEIVNGVSERGGHTVVRKNMKQWSMRITAYAQRLLDGLGKIDWPQPLKDSQTNWIGRSEGAMVSFNVLSNGNADSKKVNLTFKEIEALKLKRSNPSKAEALLWDVLRKKKGASKFRTKYTIGTFLVDFVCLAKNTIVEFSGKEDEAARTAYFESEGFSVVRFSIDEVLDNSVTVVYKIDNALQFPKAHKSKEKIETVELDSEFKIEVFTTRPDTIFGVSFMTLAPEHELVSKITTEAQKKEVEAYIKKTSKRSELERMADVKTISGVFTGAYALHPFTGEKVQIWIGDYVLAGYGTGAVMAVPCGDQRDYDFAKHFNIEIPNIFEGVDISEEACSDKEGVKIANSDFLNGLTYKKAMKRIIFEIEEKGIGYGKINYRLRDAVFSRQRYWGEPFPVYYKNGLPQMIDKQYLPIVLPEVEKYLPTEDGKPPLGNALIWAWDTNTNTIVSNKLVTLSAVEGSNDDNGIYPLELNTMPGWAGSSSYFNRYMDPENTEEFVGKEAVEYWQDIDLYIGGSEHATGHLLYSRFWQKFLFDKGIVPVDEYAKKLINQGMITGTSAFVYRVFGDAPMSGTAPENVKAVRGIFTSNIFVSKEISEKIEKGTLDFDLEMEILNKVNNQAKIANGKLDKEETKFGDYQKIDFTPIHSDVAFVNGSDELDVEAFKNWREEYKDAEFVLEDGKYIVGREVEKMSKSKYNVVNPDAICEEYGADSLRLFEMFLGPLEQSKPWKTSGISGVHSFLKKLWKLYIVNDAFSVSDEEPTNEELKTLHKTIKKVEYDIANFSFNTSVSNFMIAVNELTALKCNKRAILEPLAIIMEPYAPHIAEELWSKLGYKTSVSTVDFPIFEPKYLIESSKEYPVSFNGKMRFKLELPMDFSKEEIEAAVMAHEKTQAQLEGRTPKKVIVVPGKIINIVG
tara:strand:- start:3610 stop:7026 length:3417 start_codon:yes stop_codon:yes gene_type:complete